MALHANRPASNARASSLSCLIVLLLCRAVQFSFDACPASPTKCASLIVRVSGVHVTSERRVSVATHRDCRES